MANLPPALAGDFADNPPGTPEPGQKSLLVAVPRD
jgi:hypothetical protein